MECLLNLFFGCQNEPFDLPITKKKEKKTYSNLWRLSKMKFLFEDQVISLWPSYISERRTTLSKAYGIKA
jgi:hypothetical protein